MYKHVMADMASCRQSFVVWKLTEPARAFRGSVARTRCCWIARGSFVGRANAHLHHLLSSINGLQLQQMALVHYSFDPVPAEATSQ